MWIEIVVRPLNDMLREVTPYAGVWIEILLLFTVFPQASVTPYAGVWIEINDDNFFSVGKITSLPTRECGLKSLILVKIACLRTSLPTRECGLKFRYVPLWSG